jgi:hypothetical protein
LENASLVVLVFESITHPVYRAAWRATQFVFSSYS